MWIGRYSEHTMTHSAPQQVLRPHLSSGGLGLVLCVGQISDERVPQLLGDAQLLSDLVPAWSCCVWIQLLTLFHRCVQLLQTLLLLYYQNLKCEDTILEAG